jgi:putative flippase GtrA
VVRAEEPYPCFKTFHLFSPDTDKQQYNFFRHSMSRLFWLTIKYAAFAVVATAANLATQYGNDQVYTGPYGIYASLALGTVVGLVVKYVLDKRYIFSYVTNSLSHDGRLFLLYSLMGLLTTAIFWGTELLFEFAFRDDLMRYLGGALGLGIGYMIKYQLDRKYVFKERV